MPVEINAYNIFIVLTDCNEWNGTHDSFEGKINAESPKAKQKTKNNYTTLYGLKLSLPSNE